MSYGALKSTFAQAPLGPYSQLPLNSEHEEITTLWIGNVTPGTSDADLANAFSRFGHLLCCFLLKKLSPQGHLSGFVRYTSVLEATDALDAVQNSTVVVHGAVLTAKWASQNSKPLQEKLTSGGFDALQAQALQTSLGQTSPSSLAGEEITTLWVGNAVRGTTDGDLAAGFEPYGELVCCFLLKKLSPNGQLSGFVRYATRDEATGALEAASLGQIVVNGATLTAKWASQNSQPLKNPDVAKQQHQAALAALAMPQQVQVTKDATQLVASLAQPEALEQALQVLQSAVQTVQLASAQHQPPQTEEITTLWVGNASPMSTDNDLAFAFGGYGNLLACFLLPKLSPNGQKSGFVRYTAVSEAAHALEQVERGNVQIHGVTLTARWAAENSKITKGLADVGAQASLPDNSIAAPQNSTSQALEALSQAVQAASGSCQSPAGTPEEITTLWVGNALPGTTDQDLMDAFSRFGNLVCCFLLKKLSPNGNMSGFVRYQTRLEAHMALDAATTGNIVIRGAIITAKWASQNSKPLGEKQQQQQPAQPQPLPVPPAPRSLPQLHEHPPQQQQPQAIDALQALAGALQLVVGGGGAHGTPPNQGPLRHSTPPPPPLPTYAPKAEEITTLWVGNVPPGTTDADLMHAMGTFGNLMVCFLLKTLSPQGQLSGFVRYYTVGEASFALKALEAGAVTLQGAALKGRWAKENSKPLSDIQTRP